MDTHRFVWDFTSLYEFLQDFMSFHRFVWVKKLAQKIMTGCLILYVSGDSTG